MAARIEPPRRKGVGRTRLIAFLLIGVLLAVIGIRYYRLGQKSPEKLYQKAFVDYTPRSESSAAKAYREGRYEAVIDLSSRSQMSGEDSLLAGLANLQRNQPQRAAYWLVALLQSPGLQEEAQFYLALGQLRQKRYEESLRLLRSISGNASHRYHERISAEWIREVEELNSQGER